MRWIPFLILLYAMAALQQATLGAIPSHSWPMILFVPMLAIFYALYAADSAAPLAALVCGAALDLLSGEFLGTNLIPLALVAWLIVRIRLSIFREHAVSQVIMTLLAILAFAVFSSLFRKLIGAPLESASLWVHIGRLAGDAVYTSIAAPFFFWLFFRFQPLLGFSAHGSRSRGHN
jgi:rod shape-determining protein MreD